jgi:hypothetical protein
MLMTGGKKEKQEDFGSRRITPRLTQLTMARNVTLGEPAACLGQRLPIIAVDLRRQSSEGPFPGEVL